MLKVPGKAQRVIRFFLRNLKKLSEISGSYTRVVDFPLMQLVEIAKG
jgi:hypothetical protein